MSTAFVRNLPFGARLVGPGRCRFRLWAPLQESVSVEIDGLPMVPMTRTTDGWFSGEATCGAGARYRFRLGTGPVVPDPAARAQAEDVHGPSLVVDPAAFRWQHTGWQGRPWQETVLYELHAGALGGFAGVQAELPRLAALGITAIELMPINDFPGIRNWGYDGVLPFAPDHAYGTPDELKLLIDAAHGHGLMVFLDVVYNHFGPDGNYLSSYAPEFFRDDISTPWGSAIDFRRPEVRRYFIENALYWLLEYRFDGLRFDAVHAIADAGWLDEMAAEVRASIEPGRHVHLVLEHDGNVAGHLRGDFDAQWNDDAHHVLHAMLTGEADGYYSDYADRPAVRLARCLAEGFAYQGEPSAYRGGERRGTASGDLPPTAFVLFLQNHDQIGNRPFGDRLTELAESAALEAAIALQLLCPQIPLLFMGEEQGSRTQFLYFTDHHGALADAVREGRRREFAGFAGFRDGQRTALIPDPNAVETFERSSPAADAASGAARLAFYRHLLALRASIVVPRLAGAKSLGAWPVGELAVVASWRMSDAAILTIATNLGRTPCKLTPPDGRIVFEQRAGDGDRIQRGELGAHTTVVLLGVPA
ncbi:MAG: malto-oligosyltrehalose trehalohydrolase [Reyranella sp.]|nr:malto-oligosyltrehalose trehalohydrolase [Reyranella sp.]